MPNNTLSQNTYQDPLRVPFHNIISWHNDVWKLSSVLYESIPAHKAGLFFRHLQQMFEANSHYLTTKELGVNTTIKAIGLYCRILHQLESYSDPEFSNSISSLISTSYGNSKARVSAEKIYRIADEIGYSLESSLEDSIFCEAIDDRAFQLTHFIHFSLEDIIKNHSFNNKIQKTAIEFYFYLTRFVIYSGLSDDHRLVPSYVTSKLAELLNSILSYPISVYLPSREDFFQRECFAEGAPSLYEAKIDYGELSQDLELAAIPVEQLIEQLQHRGLEIAEIKKQVASDLVQQAKNNPALQEKLTKWGQSLGNEVVGDVMKEIVKLAIRSIGIPLP